MNSKVDPTNLKTGTLQKEYGTSGGITLRTFAGKLIISHITPEASKATGLKRGLEIVSMNNVDCSLLSETSAQRLLLGDEMVTFLGRELATASIPGTLVTSVLYKEDEDVHVGMGVKIVNGQLCVGTIKAGSLAAGTDLKTDLIIKKINNMDCAGLNPNQAATLLSDAVGEVRILAQVPGEVPQSQRISDLTTITVSLDAEFDVDSDLEEEKESGVELMSRPSLEDGKPLIVVKSIAKGSPFLGSALRVGLQICQVQNIDCTAGASVEEVSKLLKDNTKQGETIVILGKSTGKHVRVPGSFLTVVLDKESAHTKLGISLASRGETIFIKKITNGTLASTSELEAGMFLHRINNICLTGKSVQEAVDILASQQGLLSLLCQTTGGDKTIDTTRLVTATMVKQEGDKVGVALLPRNGELFISKIVDGFLASTTALHVGMRVVQINNTDVAGKSNKEAAEMLTSTLGLLTILAAKPDRAGGSLVVASIVIPEVAEGEKKPSFGIKIGKTVDGSYIITGIKPNTLVADTELKEQMILKSINNVECASKPNLNEVMELFTQASGVLNILAAVPGGNPLPTSQLVTACCVTGREVPEGSIVYNDATKKIFVTNTGAGGLMYGTALRAGMEILAINNVEAGLFSKAGLKSLLDSQEKLTFLAMRQQLTPDLVITEVLHKEAAGDKVGLGLAPRNGKIFISSIKDGTLASMTRFLPGMELISIDNEDCLGMDVRAVVAALRDAVGDITVVATTKAGGLGKNPSSTSLVTAVINKGEKGGKVGLSFVRKGGLLVITSIAEGGAAAETDLLVGMDVISINNIDVSSMSSKEASILLGEAEGNITILARRPALMPGAFVTASIIKEEGASIGIKMVGLKTGGVMIKSVAPQSLASFTELVEGMLIVSINNVNCSKMDTKSVATLMREDKNLTILAQTTKEIAMGRSSYRSMRSLSGNRSVGESIASYGSTMDPNAPHEIKEIGIRSSTPDTMKSISSYESPVKESETITVITGGTSASFIVKNVVDC